MPLRPRWMEATILRILTPAVDALVRARIHPNAITTAGFVVSVAAAVGFAHGHLRLAGAGMLLAGAFDIFDGRVARGTGLQSTFGSFYDSTLDRISEIIIFVGLIAFFLHHSGTPADLWMVYAVALALGGSLMVSYTRARAEALGLDCTVGLMQRPERVFMLGAAALLFGSMWDALVLRGVIVVVAVLANFTAFQRIHWVYRHTREPRGSPGSGSKQTNKRTPTPL